MFWQGVSRIRARLEAAPVDEEIERRVQIVVPLGSRLRMSAFQKISEELGASIEVKFARNE